MRFFTDENVSTRAARMLDAFDRENEVRAFEDYFQARTSRCGLAAVDLSLGSEANHRLRRWGILRNRAELTVLRECSTAFVYLAKGWMNADWNTFAWKIVKVWPKIVHEVTRTRSPSVFEVRLKGEKIEIRSRISEL